MLIMHSAGKEFYQLKFSNFESKYEYLMLTTDNGTTISIASEHLTFKKEAEELVHLEPVTQLGKISSDKPISVFVLTGSNALFVALLPKSEWVDFYFINVPRVGNDFEYFVLVYSRLLYTVRIDSQPVAKWEVKKQLNDGIYYGSLRYAGGNYITANTAFGCYMYARSVHSGNSSSFRQYLYHTKSPNELFEDYIDNVRKKEGLVEEHNFTTMAMSTLPTTDIDVTTDMTTLKFLAAKVCLIGYYGQRCEFECNCTKPFCSKINGTCYEEDCQKGWFGDECNIEDLTVYAVHASPSAYFDGDSTTCRPLENKQVFIELYDRFYLTSFTFVLEEPETVKEKEVVVKFYNGKTKTFDFSRERILVFTEKPNRFRLQMKAVLRKRKFYFEFKKDLSICSIYV
ncbi:uncharacterized protein LOC131939391 [Physella acuta]|uniref:uncharacterized protein LOC131939391 n=1 Tax=Physella acuta TaxID=109671 RepID=UPI0027DC8699|nr:uncharacterized protein LOC131939391 [Physella acuta]